MPPASWEPPVPQKSGPSGGLIAGIIGVVLVLLIGIGAVVYFVASGDDEGEPSANPSTDSSNSDGGDSSGTDSGDDTGWSSESRPTDLFPDTLEGAQEGWGLMWTLSESGAFDCDQVGTSEVTAVLIAQGCEEVHVASYVDTDQQYAVTVGVIDFGDVTTADAAEHALDAVLPASWTSSTSPMDSTFRFLTPDGSGITSDTQVQGSRDAYENYLLYSLGAGYDGSDGEPHPTWDVELGVSIILGVSMNYN